MKWLHYLSLLLLGLYLIGFGRASGYLRQRTSTSEKLPVGMIQSSEGRATFTRIRPKPMPVHDEVYEDDLITVIPGAKVRVFLYQIGQIATITGSGTVRLRPRKVIPAGGKPKIAIEATIPLSRLLPHHGLRPAIVSWKGASADFHITSPLRGQRNPPTEITWTSLPPVAAVPPTGISGPYLRVHIVHRESGNFLDRKIAYDPKVKSIELPEHACETPGAYDVTLDIGGYGVTPMAYHAIFFVMPPSMAEALPEVERTIVRSSKPQDWLDLISVYRFWNLTEETDRVLELGLKKFPGNSAMKQASIDWQKDKEGNK